MAKKKRDARARTELRASARQQEKLFEARTKLALLEPGGTPARPLELSSASVVEARAEAEPCLRCDRATRCVEHTTLSTPHGLLRVARVRCPGCGSERLLYLRILPSRLH